MQPFTQHRGLVVPLDRSNVDTDAIIPKQFLKAITRTGYGPFLFDAWRYDDAGGFPGQDCSIRPLNMDFVLNQPRYQGGSVLLARENFGCGSSREHAAWALVDAGFRVIIAESFGEIFHGNAVKNGLLPITLDGETVDALFRACETHPGYTLEVDLSGQQVVPPVGGSVVFEVEPDVRDRLLHGLDDIGLTLEHSDSIRAFEHRRAERFPWLYR
ncbi:MAG: 3-isopropylmalate dehydratase small subunit [Ectothiorhodospiraceae bacterium]|nr:3-isopropylmalate dehydratase small subunit [Ectothiorhodospiraceae bacterium]